MKYKTTRKQVKSGYSTIIEVGYCNLQYLLQYHNPEAYTTRSEGWGADVYDMDRYGYGGVAIVTGYAPFGNNRLPYNKLKEYDNEAKSIIQNYNMEYPEKREAIRKLVQAFITEVLYN